MTPHDDEALDAATWFERMGRFADGLVDESANPDRHIRKAYHLHCLAPAPLKTMMAEPMAESRLEALLECGAYESAVVGLIGPTGQVTVRDNNGDAGIDVRMRIDPVAPQSTQAAEAWPMAMLEAWAVSYLRLRPIPN